MVPLATNGTIGKITNGTIGRTPNEASLFVPVRLNPEGALSPIGCIMYEEYGHAQTMPEGDVRRVFR